MHARGEEVSDAAAPIGEEEIGGSGATATDALSSLNDIPAVRDYLRRIGAEPRSMLTAVVREREDKYWRDVAVIRLDKTTGTITITADGDDGEVAPTESEKRRIEDAVIGLQWPALQPLQAIINPPDQMRNAAPDDVFEFRSENGTIQMVQVRVEKDGEKAYLPWTYWSDGQWRQMEPDGLLPLWGASQFKKNSILFLHEGAKAARAVTEMVNRGESHPWFQHMAHAAHCGWIGGAHSPHRTDWSVIRRAGITLVYIVADNDPEGHSAVPKISKLLREYPIPVIAVRFDDRFPAGFDLADPFPADGPTFDDCCHPATWATRIGAVPPAQGTRQPRPPLILRKEFEREWFMVAGEGDAIFINRFDRSRLYTEKAFNTAVRPLSDSARTSDLFKQHAYAQQVKAIAYEPGDKQGVISVEGVRSINTWTAPRIRPAEGDARPWLDFMEHLFPQADDRLNVMKLCATLIARPSHRMLYGLLLCSTKHGVGKTTLCEILRVLVGEKNCRSPSATDVVDSQFNSWIVRKRLVFVNEIYAGESWTAYNKIKSYITDQTLEANEKMIRSYSVRNWAHFILCSNSEVPLSLADDDRRFLVPEVTELARPHQRWVEFYSWLESGGYAVIAGWAERFVAEHGAVEVGEHAPDSARKRSLIEDSRSHEEQLVRSIADAAKERGGQVVLVENEIARWLEDKGGRRFKPSTVRTWLRKAGLCVSDNRVKVRGEKSRVAGVLPLESADGWPALAPHHVKPEDLEVL
jgi:hypothetical protein